MNKEALLKLAAQIPTRMTMNEWTPVQVAQMIRSAIVEHPSPEPSGISGQLDDVVKSLSSSPGVPKYAMSRDYEALWEHLEKGGEALGRIQHPESSPRFPVIEATDIRPLHVPLWHHAVRGGREAFLQHCQRLNLEYIAVK